MRQTFDNTNGALAVVFIVLSFLRAHLSELATGAAFIYSLMLIGEKIVFWHRARKLKRLALDESNHAGV